MGASPRVTPPQTGGDHVIRDSALGMVPETIEHFIDLTAAIWDASPLSAAEIELARLRNANYVGCVFCKAVRYDVAIDAGLDEGKVAMINDNFADSELSDRNKLILRFVDHYLHSPGVPDADFQAELKAEFSSEELLHLSLLMAYFNGFSKCAVALGGMPDSMPRMEISVPR